jgi:hypothetical protein
MRHMLNKWDFATQAELPRLRSLFERPYTTEAGA